MVIFPKANASQNAETLQAPPSRFGEGAGGRGLPFKERLNALHNVIALLAG